MNWEAFKKEVHKLSEQVSEKPDVIIGITRGGIIPARLLSAYLKIEKMHCISVGKNGSERFISTEIKDDLRGKNILLVEDILETGRSLQVAKSYLEKKGAKIKTATLYTMPITEVKPDYYLEKIETLIKFPWE